MINSNWKKLSGLRNMQEKLENYFVSSVFSWYYFLSWTVINSFLKQNFPQIRTYFEWVFLLVLITDNFLNSQKEFALQTTKFTDNFLLIWKYLYFADYFLAGKDASIKAKFLLSVSDKKSYQMAEFRIARWDLTKKSCDKVFENCHFYT